MTFDVPTPFAWDATFCVKNTLLNDQHKVLFTMINDLAADQQNATILKNLLDYVVMHFKTEEDLFAKIGWAETAAHKAIHDKFVADCLAVKAIDDGIIAFLKQWLVNHIKCSDAKYADLLANVTL